MECYYMWFYKGEQFTEDMINDYVGFVYIIHNVNSNKKYLGKKNFTKPKTYQKNKKKKRKTVSSDWLSYYGSNKTLQEDVAKSTHPEQEFRREIIRLCASKAEMSYYETKLIFMNDCLLLDDWYNHWVSCRINQNTLRSLKNGPAVIGMS